jgi:hypothetical protein
MNIKLNNLRKFIREEYEKTLDAKHPADIEPVEDSFSGGDNLFLPIDHSDAVGSEEVTPEPETMEIVEEDYSSPRGGFSPMKSRANGYINQLVKRASKTRNMSYDMARNMSYDIIGENKVRISKRKLKRIIREEKRRLRLENCGLAVDEPVGMAVEPEVSAVSESAEPVQDLMVEMALASRSLEQVVESVQAAAGLCPECESEIAAQAPLMEAMVAQAEALQETLEAQATVIAESAGMVVPEDDSVMSVELV